MAEGPAHPLFSLIAQSALLESYSAAGYRRDAILVQSLRDLDYESYRAAVPLATRLRDAATFDYLIYSGESMEAASSAAMADIDAFTEGLSEFSEQSIRLQIDMARDSLMSRYTRPPARR